MNKKHVVPLLFFAFGSFCPADESSKAVVDELIASIRQGLKDNSRTDERQSNDQQLIRQLKSAIISHDIGTLEQILSEGEYPSLESPEWAPLAEKLRNIIAEEKKNRIQAKVAVLETLLAEAKKVVETAETPEDLDGIVEKFIATMAAEENEESGDTGSTRLRTLQESLTNANQFLFNWQDYLQAKQSGSTSDMISKLNSTNQNQTTLVPRSRLIRLIDAHRSQAMKSQSDAISKLLENTKGLDQLQETLGALTSLQGSGRYYDGGSDLSAAIQAIGVLEKIYREARAGLPVNLDISESSSNGISTTAASSLLRLRVELIKMAIPGLIAVDGAAESRTEESIHEYIERLLKGARDREDFSACQRITQIRSMIARDSHLPNPDKIGLAEYTAAQNQLSAGQYMPAVVSLEKALKSGSELIPSAKIGEQLASIKKDHPVEFEKGMAEFLNPQRVQDYPSGMRGSQYGDPARPPTSFIPTSGPNAPRPQPSSPPSPDTGAPLRVEDQPGEKYDPQPPGQSGPPTRTE